MSGLVCLLPAQRGGGSAGWLAGVRGWVDAVLALDDGSTDETGRTAGGGSVGAGAGAQPAAESYAGGTTRRTGTVLGGGRGAGA